jgi:hypothetical protein
LPEDSEVGLSLSLERATLVDPASGFYWRAERCEHARDEQGWMWAVVPVIDMLYIAIQAIELQLQYRDHARRRAKDPAS